MHEQHDITTSLFDGRGGVVGEYEEQVLLDIAQGCLGKFPAARNSSTCPTKTSAMMTTAAS